MTAAYVAFAVLGAAILASDSVPAWLGGSVSAWGVVMVLGLVLTRFAGPFNPPILAHTYTAVVGVTMLLI